MLNRQVQRRKSLLAMMMLLDSDSSSSSSSSSDDHFDDSSSSRSARDAVIFMAAVNSLQEKKLEFARKSRYTFRLGYRKLDEDDVFIRDLNTGNDNERPWLTADEFKQKYRMSREALLVIAERIKDDDVFKNKRGPSQMNPTHQLMVLLDYLGTAGSGANNPKQCGEWICEQLQETGS